MLIEITRGKEKLQFYADDYGKALTCEVFVVKTLLHGWVSDDRPQKPYWTKRYVAFFLGDKKANTFDYID